MRRGEKLKFDRYSSLLGAAAIWTVRIVGSVIFLVLAWYAFRYTQYMNPLGDEVPLNVPDSRLKNLLFLGIAVGGVLGLMLLEKRLSEKIKQWVMRISLLVLSLWTGGWGLWWITVVDRHPMGDQAYVYGGASYFMEGQYFFLEPGGYCAMCPHQLGLISLIEMFFNIVGPQNYFACQVVLVEMAVGIAVLGFWLVRRVSECMTVAVVYSVMMLGCFPLFFYTGWVYGDIPCAFFSILVACCLIKYSQSAHWGWLVGVVISAVLATLARQNSLIMVIALCLVGAIYALQKKDKKLLIALVFAAILPSLSYSAIYKMYEVRSDIPHEEGFPSVSYIAMGMQERWGKYGWYTAYCKEVYYANEMNTEMSAVASKQDIKSRLAEFKANPSYAVMFYREKILSQWNAPLYQCMYFGSQYLEDREPEPGTFVDKLNGEYFVGLLGICDRLQFILYAGMVCYFLFAVRKDSNILQHLLAVTIIGGFFFSILWEAKARYIFPYYVTMYSLASIGYWEMFRQVQLLVRRKPIGKEDDNIVPFRKVA